MGMLEMFADSAALLAVMAAPAYLSVDDLVERYKGTITKGTLANWRANRKGPSFVKLGGRVLYLAEKVIAWEKSNEREHV